MGYSVSVPFKTAKEQQRMKSFLLDNLSILEKLAKTELVCLHQTEPVEGEHLGYTPKIKNLLGFSGTGIPHYTWYLCAWMAIKSSVRSKKGEIYFYYDDERMYVTHNKENKQHTVVDNEGLKIIEKVAGLNYIFLWLKPETGEKEQYQLMKELNEKWHEYNK